MCGVIGQVLRRPGSTAAGSSAARGALDSLRHRGPDTQGEFGDDQIWFGHTRLCILDLSAAGSQPMATPDGRFVICYNGEVYNFAELAGRLNITELRSHSDTEVVLRAFASEGVSVFQLLNGIFAFAIYDRLLKKIWLVRDRLGVKPLYYRLDETGLSFASEIKALLHLESQSPKCDVSAIHEWLYYGTTLGERTLYAGIRKLLPGSYIELDVKTFHARAETYWSPKQYANGPKFVGSVDEMAGKVRHLLEEAVKRQLVSDVPVGVFLSGGIDSSAITAFAARHYGSRLATYSVGFDFAGGINELDKAKGIAELYGTDHHEVRVSGFEIADVVEKMVDQHDLPFSDAANIPLYLLSSRINGTTKVALQGDGGDELFGGYTRYTTMTYYKTARALARAGNVVNRWTPRRTGYHRRQRYINALSGKDHGQVMALLLTEEDSRSRPETVFSAEIRERLLVVDPFARYRECQSYFRGEDLVNQMLFVDSMIILPDIFLEKVDRATMAASVEVRVPFLDNDLVDFCLRLSGAQKVRFGQKKWLLKKALEGIVPNHVLYGKKTGFGVPYGYWLRDALRPLFLGHLEAFERDHPSVFDGPGLKKMYEDHVSGRRDRSFLLWKVLNFMIWSNRTGVSLEC